MSKLFLTVMALGLMLPVSAHADETIQQEKAAAQERADYSDRSPAVKKFYGQAEKSEGKAMEYSKADRTNDDPRVLNRAAPAAGSVDTDGFEMGVLKHHNE